jgi:hypothetical protein
MDESTRSAGVWVGARDRMIRSWLMPVSAAAILVLTAFGATAMAANEASVLPPNWDIHDGQTALGSQHKGSGSSRRSWASALPSTWRTRHAARTLRTRPFCRASASVRALRLRAGECQTSTAVIHLRTVPLGTAGPDGWSSVTSASEPGWVTYYQVTAN